MKKVKLPSNMILYQAGFRYALKFPESTAKTKRMEDIAHEVFGESWSRWRKWEKNAKWGYYTVPPNGRWSNRTYYIAFREEQDITKFLLMI
jgi:hypothetical protein